MRRLVCLVASITVTAACGEGVGPKPFAGTYGLFRVLETETPPVTVYIGSTRTTIYQRIELLADTLELKADGSYVERSVTRSTLNETTSTPTVTIDTSMGLGTFSVTGADTLSFLANTMPAHCAFLCGLQMKTATNVVVRADTLAFQNVVFGGLHWDPRFGRRP
jgi:hypothetical protein